MNLSSVLSTLPSASPRFVGVTILGWVLIVIGTLGLPISAFTLLTLLVRGYGSASATVGGTLLVVGGPLALIATGIGLLFRQPLAHGAALVLAVAVVAVNLATVLRGPTPTREFVDANGVKNTVFGSTVNYPFRFGAIAFAAGVGGVLLLPRVRGEFWSKPSNPPPLPAATSAIIPPPPQVRSNGSSAWRVGHRGRDQMFYEEFVGGLWQRLEIDGEMLMGRAHHVIYFASPTKWAAYPEWARFRRAEIIARVKSEFRAPDYEYQGE